MKVYDENADGVLDTRELILLLKDIVKTLLEEQRSLGVRRLYDQAAFARDQATKLTTKIRELEEKRELARQEQEKADFEQACGILQERHDIEMKACRRNTEAEMEQRRHLLHQKLSREKEDLERQLGAQPPPKPRFSSRLIAMRHAEMFLSKTERYKEAFDVRRNTKVDEEKEYNAVKDDFERKQELRRARLYDTHDFEALRSEETLKDMHWRNKRHIMKEKKRLSDTIKFNKEDIEHALKMEVHKVKRTMINAEIPSCRYINKTTNPSCRGSRKLEQAVGKRFLAIPGLSEIHDFTNTEDFPLIAFTERSARSKQMEKQAMALTAR